MTSIPTRGRLEEIPVPELLLRLYGQRYSGALSLQSDRTLKKVAFREGAPVATESDLPSESLCAQLVEAGSLRSEDLPRVQRTIGQKGYDEAAALLSLGLIQPRDLFMALKHLLRRRILECFAWPGGAYELLDGTADGEELAPFRCDPIALVQEGVETHWGVDRILGALTPNLERYPNTTPSLAKAAARLHTDDETRALLAAMDGRSSLGQILSQAARSQHALAAAWVLDTAGLLRYSDSAVGVDVADGLASSEAEIEIEISEPAGAHGSLPRGGASGGDGSGTGQPTESSTASPAAGAAGDAMRQEIEERRATLSDADFYELLQVERNAGAGEIKRAYFRAAKRYHPDALARLGLEDLKQEAAEVFSRMAEAYEVLSDTGKRSEYDTSVDSDEPQIDAAVLAQAETFFRKGEILVRMGDFRGALQYLQSAVDLWPAEAAYQSTLGWALYKKTPPEPERARAHLETARDLAPEDAVAHFRLGLVLRAAGETNAANEALARAKQLDPTTAT